MIVFLRLQQFYARESQQPTVVVQDKAILDANSAARRLGVVLGMPLALAKTLLGKGSGQAPSILPWKAEEYEAAQDAWLSRCVDFSDVIEPVDQHEAFVDLSEHPSPESLLEGLLGGLPEGTLFGVAQVKWLARAACGVGGAAYRDPRSFLDSLPTSLLEPVSEDSRFRLEFLGYRTAGEVATVPLETLKAQFDKEALVIWQAARGRGGEAVQALYPRATLGERFYFESPVETQEAIDSALDELARRLSERLVERDLQASVMRVWVDSCPFASHPPAPANGHFDSGTPSLALPLPLRGTGRGPDSPHSDAFLRKVRGGRPPLPGARGIADPPLARRGRVGDLAERQRADPHPGASRHPSPPEGRGNRNPLPSPPPPASRHGETPLTPGPLSPGGERGFSKPMQSFASVRFALGLMCRPEGAVSCLRVQLADLKPANRKQQLLYVARTESQDTLDRAVGQVRRLYGEEVIQRGSELKLPRRVLVLRAWKDATGWS